MKRKEDLRVKKTKLNLYNGLLKLMEEKSFEEIKVTDICTKALVNRSTFYDHFNDKYELLQSYINHLSSTLSEKLSVDVEAEDITTYYTELFKIFIDEINTNFDTYKVIFNNNYNSIVVNMFIETISTSIIKYLDNNYTFKDLKNVKLGVLFYVSGLAAIISSKLKEDKKIDKDELVNFLNYLIPLFDKKKKQ